MLNDEEGKLMGCFLKKDAYEKKFGSDLVSIDCSANSQLPNADIAVEEATKNCFISDQA